MPTGIGTAMIIASLVGAGGSAVGGALAKKNKSSTTPTLDPKYGPLQDSVLSMLKKRLGTSADMSGYQAGGQQNINRTFDTIAQSQGNDLAARGLSTSPVAGAVDATRQNARAGATASFLNSIPLLQRQMQGEDLGLANNVLGQGRGSQTTQTSGGGAAGGFENLSDYLGFLMQSGAFKKPSPGFGTTYATPNATTGWG